MALEFVLWLVRTDFKGHVYFDTFPRNEDPVREAEFNIRRVKALFATAKALVEKGHLEVNLANHDALKTLTLLEDLKAL